MLHLSDEHSFPKGSYEYVEQILRLAKNEMRYRGNVPGIKKPVPVVAEEIKQTRIKKAWNFGTETFRNITK